MINCSWLSTTFIITYVFTCCFSMALSNLKIPVASAACVSSPTSSLGPGKLGAEGDWDRICPQKPSLLFIFAVLVCSGWCNKLPQTRWLSQLNPVYSQPRGLKSKIKVPAGLVPPLRPWLTDGHLPAVFTWPFLCTHSPVVSSTLISDVYPAGLGPHTDDLT